MLCGSAFAYALSEPSRAGALAVSASFPSVPGRFSSDDRELLLFFPLSELAKRFSMPFLRPVAFPFANPFRSVVGLVMLLVQFILEDSSSHHFFYLVELCIVQSAWRGFYLCRRICIVMVRLFWRSLLLIFWPRLFRVGGAFLLVQERCPMHDATGHRGLFFPRRVVDLIFFGCLRERYRSVCSDPFPF